MTGCFGRLVAGCRLFCALCTRCRLMTTRVASLVVASNNKARILSKYGSRVGYVTKWRTQQVSISPCRYRRSRTRLHSLAKQFTENRCEYFCMTRLHSQSEMLQNTTASDMPDARSTHENVPQTDDPLFLGPDLAEHADRMKIKQNNKMSSKILPRTQRVLHCLCQVCGPQEPPGQSWWLTDYDHEISDSRWKSQWRTRESLGSGALDKLGRYVSPRLDPLPAPTGTTRKPMCHLDHPPETPPPELGATALPTLRAAVLGWHT